MPPTRVPVLIAGGGPSGLAAAIELGRRGVEVCVVEPRRELDALRPRAKTTSARTMEHLRRWGLAERLRAAAPLPVDHAQDVVFCTGLLGHEITRFPEAFALWPQPREIAAEAGQQVPQSLVEEVLRAGAAELPSVRLLFGWRVEQIADGADEVRAVVSGPDGARHEVAADYLLGCDGSGGISRDAIGARYEGGSGELPNLNVTFRSRTLEEQPLCALGIHYWIIGAERGGLMGRLDLDGTWWTIVQGLDVVSGDAVSEGADPVQLVRTLIGRDADGNEAHVEVLATDPWRARMLLVDRYAGRRVFLVGDAAHLNPPWGGHGFNTCVGDAVNIGWKLAAVLQAWAGPALLDSYAVERRPVAERTIAAAGDQEAFLAPAFAGQDLDDDGDTGRALRAELAEVLQVKDPEFHSLGLVLGYDYPDSPVVVPDGRPVPAPTLETYTPSAHPGARLPHAWLPDGGSLYDRLGAGFTLLLLDGDEPLDVLLDAARERRVPLDVVDLRSRPGLRERYAADLVLVRPDQHVAWRGDAVGHAGGLLDRVTGHDVELPVPVPSPRV